MYYLMNENHQQIVVFAVVVVQEKFFFLIDYILDIKNFHYIYVQEMNLNMYQVDVLLKNLLLMLIH